MLKNKNLLIVLLIIFSSNIIVPTTVFGQLTEPEILEVNDVRNASNFDVVEDLDVVFETEHTGDDYEHKIFIARSTVENFDAETANNLPDTRYCLVSGTENSTYTVSLDYMKDIEGNHVYAHYDVTTSSARFYKIYILTIETSTEDIILSESSNNFQIEYITVVSPNDNITNIFNTHDPFYQTLRIYAEEGTYNENLVFYSGAANQHTNLFFYSLGGAENTIINSNYIDQPVITISTCNQTGFDKCVIKDFTITNGNNSNGAGGIANGIQGSLYLENLIIKNNTGTKGGGIGETNTKENSEADKIFIRNCLIYNNFASDHSGAIKIPASESYIDNSTIINNSANRIGGVSSYHLNPNFQINNSIIYNNTCNDPNYDYQIYIAQTGTSEINYCFIEDGLNGISGQYTYSNIITGSELNPPDFIDPANENFRLNVNASSPCIDAGSNALIPDGLDYDLDGDARIFNNTVDMGCYESGDFNKYIFTVEDEIFCEGTDIWYKLSDSDLGVEYRLIYNYDKNTNTGETIIITTGLGYEIIWTYENVPGTYDAFASWHTLQQTQMFTTRTVEADLLPQTDLDVEGDEVCPSYTATITIVNAETDVTYTLENGDLTVEDTYYEAGNFIFKINTVGLEIGDYETQINANNQCGDRVLDNTAIIIISVPVINIEDIEAPSIASLEETIEICIDPSVYEYYYEIYVNDGVDAVAEGYGHLFGIEICFEIICGDVFQPGLNDITVVVTSEEGCETRLDDIITICVVSEGTMLNETISGDFVYNNDTYLINNTELMANSSLTFNNCIVYLAEDALITVNPSAELIINQGTLTTSCDAMWQGIDVLGNSGLSQTPSSNQGYLEITGEAKIENAEIAVYVGKRGIVISTNLNGGIIEIDDAVFSNNIIGIRFDSYENPFGLPIPNVSFIKNSKFETTDVLATLNQTPDKFISLYYIDGIELDNNDFINSNPEAYGDKQQGDGICSWNTNYFSTFCFGYGLKFLCLF